MSFLERINHSIVKSMMNECIYYPSCGKDIGMITRILLSKDTIRTFVYCDAPRPGEVHTRIERQIEAELTSFDFKIISREPFFIDGIVNLQSLTNTLVQKYGPEYAVYIKRIKENLEPFINYYKLEYKDTEIDFFLVLFEPVSFLEVLFILKENLAKEMFLGLILKRPFRGWKGSEALMQLNSFLIKKVDPKFIISPKEYWKEADDGNFHFINWKESFILPKKMDDTYSVSYKRGFYSDRNKDYKNFKELKRMGLTPYGL